jgi:hypothetical protein
MRKMLLIPLISCMVALLPTLWMPAVHATPPTLGGGWFDQLIPEEGMEMRFAGDNIIIHVWGGGGTLYGFMEGVWIHDEWQVVHLADGIVTVNGVWDTPEGVTVNGAEGTVHVRYGGTVDMATGVFQGRWVIISGTGDLVNLSGQGTVLFDPAIDPLYAWYTGKYHFDP